MQALAVTGMEGKLVWSSLNGRYDHFGHNTSTTTTTYNSSGCAKVVGTRREITSTVAEQTSPPTSITLRPAPPPRHQVTARQCDITSTDGRDRPIINGSCSLSLSPPSPSFGSHVTRLSMAAKSATLANVPEDKESQVRQECSEPVVFVACI